MGALIVEHNAGLRNVEGLQALVEIDAANTQGQALQITNNSHLSNVDALYDLAKVAGGITVAHPRPDRGWPWRRPGTRGFEDCPFPSVPPSLVICA